MAGTPVRSVGEPVPARGTRLGVVSGAVLGRSLELQEKGFGEKPAHPRRIEPGGSAGISDEGDGAAHAELAIQAAELSREGKRPAPPPVKPARMSSSTFFDGLMFKQFDGARDVCGQKPAASHHGCWREMPHQQP